MRFKKLDLNLLVALDALLTEKNVTRAGERVFLSQSTMSNALSRLRQYFDDELLVQVGARMELTPRAALLHDAVRDVLVRIDTTIAAKPAFDPTESEREFTLFVSDYSMEVLIPGMLALASEQRSRVRFNLQPQVSQPHRHLERGEADLLIIPQAFCSPDHPLDGLFEDQFVCVVWRDSALAQGELSFIDSSVDSASGTVTAKALLPNEDGALWPGQYVDVEIELGQTKGAVTIPMVAVQPGQDGPFVFVVGSDDKAGLRPVTLGDTMGDQVVVSQGLAVGERVVVEGQQRLQDGMRVAERAPAKGTGAGP